MKTIKSLALAIMTLAAMALVSCNQNEPDAPDTKPGKDTTSVQTRANVMAYYVTTADVLKYCDMTITSDGMAVEGTVKTLNESSLTTEQVNNVVTLVKGYTTMTTDEIRIVELTSQKVVLGKHQMKVVLSRNTTPAAETTINMAHGILLSSTDGNVSAPSCLHIYADVVTATGLDGQGDDNILSLLNELGTLDYTVRAQQ